jgi:hypothetical protein
VDVEGGRTKRKDLYKCITVGHEDLIQHPKVLTLGLLCDDGAMQPVPDNHLPTCRSEDAARRKQEPC